MLLTRFISHLVISARILQFQARFNITCLGSILIGGGIYNFKLIFNITCLGSILIGGGICLLVSLVLFPVWAGEDLHQMLIANLQNLIVSFEGCLQKYFEDEVIISSSDEEGKSEGTLEDPIYDGYRAILDCKVAEESLANCARWEPCHGRFRFRYPWTQYLKIGGMLRHCAYSVVALLHGCLRSEIQVVLQFYFQPGLSMH